MRIVLLLLLLCTAGSAWSQRSGWKEYKVFYAAVKDILHPAEYEDLKPVRDSSWYLLKKAKEWQASRIPDGIKAEPVQKSLAELVTLCTELHNAVLQKKNDEELYLLAVKTHNKFHYIDGRQLFKQ